jgi:putative restriction endonuclease
MTAGVYKTTVQARAVDPEFHKTVLSRYNRTCPVSGVDHPELLDVAHVLPWSDYPDHRADLENVLLLSKTHHAAFDREVFTIDEEYRLRVNPEFETESDMLHQKIVEQHGTRIGVPEGNLDSAYIQRHNSSIDWV